MCLGALKKRVVVEKEPTMMNSLGRSTLKVRWKDMIEISNVVVCKDSGNRRQRAKSPIPTTSTSKDEAKREKEGPISPKTDDSNINDIYIDEYDLDDDDGDIDEDNETTMTTSSEESSSSGEDENNGTRQQMRRSSRGNKVSSAVERMIPSEKKRLNAGLGAGMGSLAKITTSEHLLLEPLHATGREFEKEMNDRIDKLSRIKVYI